MSDVVKLPCGSTIDLEDFDARDIKSLEDAHVAMSILQEKIIEIDYQLECYGLGFHPDGEPFSPNRPPPPLWAPRAKKALAYSKLAKSEVQLRLQGLSRKESEDRKTKRQREREYMFVEVARSRLDGAVFSGIMAAACEICGEMGTHQDEAA